MDIIDKRLDFFDSFIDNYQLGKDGVNLNIWCPFCRHKSKSKLKLCIHLEKGFYHCWVCDKKGSNIPNLLKYIDKSKVEESKKYFKSYNKKFSLFEEEIEEEYINILLPDNFKFFIENFNPVDPDARDVFKYAIKRGTNKHKLCMLRMGYSLDQNFKRYLILPSYDKCGNLNYYVSRNIDVDTHNSYKYKNAPVPKKNIIFNELNIYWKKPLTIVEGPLDLIKTNDNATCLLGSSLTEDMILFQQIIKNRTPINLALDSDAYSKALSIAKLLHGYDIDVNIVDTRGGEDVGDMSHKKFLKRLEDSKEYSYNDSILSKIRML
tara:strand:+ start:402 stop:1364 length:963 start_codon:yes stop_codon:yes gene_type:complete